MGKKKKPNKNQGGAGNQFASLAERPASPAPEAELEEGSSAWLEEQRRMLEQYQSSKPQSGGGSSSDAVPLDSASTAVIDRQRRLLEAAAGGGGGNSCSSNSGGNSGDASGSEVFGVRRVSFVGREVPVLLQNRNGPCSLLAVANSLLLRGTLRLSDQEDFITSSDLVTRLGHLCETLNAKAIQEDANVCKSIQVLVKRLPKFLHGLDVNVQFGGCSEFEYTEDLALFDYLGLQLYHVWVEPEVSEVANGYNALAERLAICAEIRGDLERDMRPPTPVEGEKLAEAIWLEEWLEETRSQATPLGFRGLMEAVKEREVCVLFRNNHFTTVFKPRSEVLCALLTDVSFESTASAVWESIELNNASSILDAKFTASAGNSGSGAGSSNAELSGNKAELMQIVQEMGFSRVQAEAGLVSVAWSSAEEAVEALLEANGDLPAPPPPPESAASTGHSTKHACPTCGKEFKSFNSQLNHRAAKAH